MHACVPGTSGSMLKTCYYVDTGEGLTVAVRLFWGSVLTISSVLLYSSIATSPSVTVVLLALLAPVQLRLVLCNINSTPSLLLYDSYNVTFVFFMIYFTFQTQTMQRKKKMHARSRYCQKDLLSIRFKSHRIPRLNQLKIYAYYSKTGVYSNSCANDMETVPFETTVPFGQLLRALEFGKLFFYS
jgi:hypothetical protein